MADERPLYNSVAPLRNVGALVALVRRVEEREHSLPGMACFYGPSGYGKSTAATYAVNRFDAYAVQMKSVWSRKWFVERIAAEMSIKPARTIPAIVDQVAEHMAMTGRTLIIDEADVLVQRKMVEVARDLYESSGSGVILIGEEDLPQNLRAWERVHGRMLDWVPAQPGTIEDARHLAPIYCSGIEVEDALLERVHRQSGGSIRRICVNLARIREVAVTRDLRSIGAADVEKNAFHTGEAPTPRRIRA